VCWSVGEVRADGVLLLNEGLRRDRGIQNDEGVFEELEIEG